VARRQQLRSGSLPAAALRTWSALVAAVAVALRLWVHFASGRAVPAPPAPLPEYLWSADYIWSAPPLPGLILSVAHLWPEPANLLIAIELVAVVTVVGLLVRLGERWLDYRVGLLAAAGWAFCGPALAVFRVPGSEGWQAALSILCAAAMLRVARRRAPREAWRIGAAAGMLTLFSGGGLLWAVAGSAWLPVTSRKFRSRNWLLLTGLIFAGWMAVVAPVAVRNAILDGGDPVFPLADGAAGFYVAMVEPGLSSGSDAEARAIGDAALIGAGVPDDASEWTRSWTLVRLALESGGEGWGAAWRRFAAPLGGWLPEAESSGALPWWWLTVAAWVGVVALLPGTRFLFPLLLGGFIPLLRGMFGGVDPGTAVSATPFVCLYAGYGVWRVVTGRRSPVTWAATAAVLAVALLVHWSVRGWS
jgi:hypothetical protein